MKSIINEFVDLNEVGGYAPFGEGHINDTYAVTNKEGEKKWILQRINHKIFPQIEILQHNLDIVSQTIYDRLKEQKDEEINRKVLRFLRLKKDPSKNYFFDGENYWRMCYFIPRSKTLKEMNTLSARYAGEAFGQFEEILSNIPEGILGETIEKFHCLPWRLEQLDEAVAKDPCNRTSEVKDLLEKIDNRREKMLIHEKLYKEGKLPKRTIHCDTKVDNILFDENNKILCVVDWDTVMPGFILSDVGDFIRTAVCTAPEDEKDLSKIQVNMEVYKAFVEGYLSTAGKFLNKTERSLIAYGGRLMTYMQAVRFLADYIDGDNYYKIHHEKHNLERAKAQMRFLECLEEKATEMESIL